MTALPYRSTFFCPTSQIWSNFRVAMVVAMVRSMVRLMVRSMERSIILNILHIFQSNRWCRSEWRIPPSTTFQRHFRNSLRLCSRNRWLCAAYCRPCRFAAIPNPTSNHSNDSLSPPKWHDALSRCKESVSGILRRNNKIRGITWWPHRPSKQLRRSIYHAFENREKSNDETVSLWFASSCR